MLWHIWPGTWSLSEFPKTLHCDFYRQRIHFCRLVADEAVSRNCLDKKGYTRIEQWTLDYLIYLMRSYDQYCRVSSLVICSSFFSPTCNHFWIMKKINWKTKLNPHQIWNAVGRICIQTYFSSNSKCWHMLPFENILFFYEMISVKKKKSYIWTKPFNLKNVVFWRVIFNVRTCCCLKSMLSCQYALQRFLFYVGIFSSLSEIFIFIIIL